MFSKSCEYAIKALIYIHSRGSAAVKVQEISEATDAPGSYISKILQQLVRQGIVASMKGPQGGFYMEGAQAQVRLIDIVHAIDGDKIFNGCGLGIRVCSEEHPCPLHDQFKTIRNGIRKMLRQTTIEKLSRKLADGPVSLKAFKTHS